ncbi:MAG TPA: hypothetical protein VH478_00195 [Trebonia sp.]|jgi:hypothetical protein|nr:hypothetical protein [Trebonia sp.]
MTVLVDPSQRGGADEGPGDAVTTPRQSVGKPAAGEQATALVAAPPDADPAPLAEPPITGGKVEELMGRLIKVLAHSPLARPLPAVALSALGLLGVAFVGLCATAPHPSLATPPVLLPLTDLARQAGVPHLSNDASNAIMYVAITLCCLGLAMMLWANSHLGWAPSPRKVFAVAAGAIAVLVCITPVGSGDIASYASYGRIAALGQNPYTFLPAQLPGGSGNPYTAIVNPMWRHTPSVYGPIATWIQTLAALIGGPRPWVTILALMVMTAGAFLATGYVLIRTAENPVRAALMWAGNPLLIVELVMGGHLDAFLALAAIGAIVMSRRARTVRDDIVVGVLVGLAGGIKINAAYVALGIAIPLLHDRHWLRLVRTMAVAGVTTGGLYLATWGVDALKPLHQASQQIISPTIWRLIVVWSTQVDPDSKAMLTTVIGFAWEPLMLLLAWYLYNRLSPSVPTVVAATCALTFAWVIAASWSLPWYASIAWVTLALLPRNSLTRWLTVATGLLALLHFNGGWPMNMTVGPTP